MAKITEKEIEKMMMALDITREEAIEMLQFDNDEIECEEVEKLTENAKTVKAPVKRGRKPKAETGDSPIAKVKKPRAKKENPTKKTIIEALANAITELQGATEIDIKNAEKTIFFQLDGETFEIDLKQKRKPKA